MAITLAVIGLLAIGYAWFAGYLDRDPVWHFPAEGRQAAVSVLFFSGDAGMRSGMGPFIARRLAAHGVEVTALSTSTLFRLGHSRAELDHIVAEAVAGAKREAGSRRLIVIGQSYGADTVQTGLAHLPAPLRRGIAGIVLIVPGTDAYFRADPTGLLYHLAPDVRLTTATSLMRWAPLTCIYGVEETDSACPLYRRAARQVVALPGGHYLNHDKPRVAAVVLRAIGRAVAAGHA